MKLRLAKSLVLASALLGLTFGANVYAETKLKMVTTSGAAGSPSGNAVKLWADLIEESTKGTDDEIKVKVFYGDELGGQTEVFDLFMAGDVHLILTWPYSNYDKRMGLSYAPYMFTSWEQAKEAYSTGGWLSDINVEVYDELGIKYFGAWPEGFAGVATRGEYATSIDEASAKKLNVRTPPNFPFPQTMQALGYQTAAIDWGEVFTAIQTGVVDGDAGNIIYWDYEYFRDVLDYYVRTKHAFIAGNLSMNKETWAELSPNQQKAVADAAEKVMTKQFEEAKKSDQHYVDLAVKSGMKYVEPSDEEVKIMAKVVRDKVWPLLDDEYGKKIMDEVRKMAPKL